MSVDGFGAFVSNVPDAVRRGLLELKRVIVAAEARITAAEALITAVEDRPLAEFVDGTYTPTLTGMAIGTGGSAANSAEYVFVGGPNTGDEGVLSAKGRVVFGTTGRTFPTAPTISLPSGFNVLASVGTLQILGGAHLLNSGSDRVATMFVASATAVRPLIGGITGNTSGLTTTTPFAWASGGTITWVVTLPAIRV